MSIHQLQRARRAARELADKREELCASEVTIDFDERRNFDERLCWRLLREAAAPLMPQIFDRAIALANEQASAARENAIAEARALLDEVTAAVEADAKQENA